MTFIRNKSEIIKLLAKRDWSFQNESGGNGLYSIHPYPAKFIPQIPRSLIQDIGVPEGGVIFDPFCGSGTTLIEAQKMGFSSIGIDLNPIACLISKVATTPQPENLEESVRRSILFAKSIKNPTVSNIPNLDHWFKTPIQKALAAILTAIENELCEHTRDILRLGLSSSIVRVSNQDGDTRYAAVDKQISSSNVFDFFEKTCKRYIHTLSNFKSKLPSCKILCRDILEVTPEELENKIGLVICSPPYPNAYEYWLYHKYRMWWLGYDPLAVKEREIGARPHYFKKNHQTPDDFRKQMGKVFGLLRMVCIKDSYACFVIGDSKIHGEIIDNTELMCAAAEANNYEPIAILNRDILLSRKAFNLANSRLKNENIIVFQKRQTPLKSLSYSVKLNWHSYNYLPYEKRFAFREIAALPGVCRLEFNADSVCASFSHNPIEYLKRLVYFSDFTLNNREKGRTIQALLENGLSQNANLKRQSTRYGVHGLHEYKGKFNPQIVRGILNAYGIKPNAKILDPFCGSGTTLIESNISGFSAIGWDMNPFAVYLANSKLNALHSTPQKLFFYATRILKAYDKGERVEINSNNQRGEYLANWFPEENLLCIETLRAIIEREAKESASFFLIILSDLLRDYSLQEPSDLRIRRRKTPFPKKSLREQVEVEIFKYITMVEAVLKLCGPILADGKALYVDGRNWNEVEANGILKGTFDFAITSPPYATALPYIDTQRLSLVWLGLLDPISIRSADERLIGSREVTKSGLNSLHQDLNKNSSTLPEEVIEYCKLLQRHLSEKDGFRRQAVPALLYRYFSNMAYTFVTVKNAMRPGGIYALVVGTNRTTLGGTQFNIDTPIYLAEIAQHHGWSIDEMLPLETYKRYGLHVANAVQNETLIVMKNE